MDNNTTNDLSLFMKTINKWINKSSYLVIYDSDINGWEFNYFCKSIMFKPFTMLLCLTENGIIFGSYLQKPIIEKKCWMIDDDYFVFFFKSNGNVTVPARFKRNNKNFCGEPFKGCFGIGDGYFISFFSISLQCYNPTECSYNQYTHELFTGLCDDYFFPYRVDEKFPINRLIALQWNE
ncbi:TLDc domain-containing protein [Entamoeba marina]